MRKRGGLCWLPLLYAQKSMLAKALSHSTILQCWAIACRCWCFVFSISMNVEEEEVAQVHLWTTVEIKSFRKFIKLTLEHHVHIVITLGICSFKFFCDSPVCIPCILTWWYIWYKRYSSTYYHHYEWKGKRMLKYILIR